MEATAEEASRVLAASSVRRGGRKPPTKGGPFIDLGAGVASSGLGGAATHARTVAEAAVQRLMAEHPTANGVAGVTSSGVQVLDTLHDGRVPQGPRRHRHRARARLRRCQPFPRLIRTEVPMSTTIHAPAMTESIARPCAAPVRAAIRGARR